MPIVPADLDTEIDWTAIRTILQNLQHRVFIDDHQRRRLRAALQAVVKIHAEQHQMPPPQPK